AGLIAGARFMPESRSAGAARPDLIGAALAAAAATLLLLPLIQLREWDRPWLTAALLALSRAPAALFLLRGRRLAARGGQPVLDPALRQVRAFSAGLAVSLLFFGALGAHFLPLSLCLQFGTGRTGLETGLVILPFAVGAIAASGIGVGVAHRAGRALLVTGALLLAASQLALIPLVSGGADPGYPVLAAPMLVGGLG